MDDHVMVLVIEHPLPAGYMRCPADGCDCFTTWGLNPDRDPRVAQVLRTAVLAELKLSGELN